MKASLKRGNKQWRQTPPAPIGFLVQLKSKVEGKPAPKVVLKEEKILGELIDKVRGADTTVFFTRTTWFSLIYPDFYLTCDVIENIRKCHPVFLLGS